MNVLAVDLGGSHVSCALVDENSIVESESFGLPPTSRLGDVLRLLEKPLLSLRDKAFHSGAECDGLAFSFCGLVDPLAGRIVSTNAKYDDGRELDLGKWARERLSLRLLLENDARTALLGEYYAGAARGYDDVVMVTLGTGVGGAAMINGRLLHGKHFQAGCLGGHFVVNYRGRVCTCGNVGCVESEASTWALPALCRATPGFEESALRHAPSLDFRILFEASAQGDEFAMRVRDACLEAWAAGCVTMIHAYDPEVVVLGGGLMRAREQILPTLEAHISRFAWTPWGKVKVRAAELGSAASLLGAIPLFRMNSQRDARK